MTKSTLLIIASQSLLFLGLCLCFAILPQFLRSQSGVSNYGVHLATVVPYSLAFIFAAVGALAAAYYLPRTTAAARLLANLLQLLGVIFFATLLSTYPYQVGQPFRNLHVAAGALLYILELMGAVWLTFFIRKDIFSGVLFGVQVTGALVSFVSFMGLTNFLLLGQLLTGLSFSMLLARGTYTITSQALAAQPEA